MVNNQEHADVVIFAGSDPKSIYAHSQNLKTQSEYFKSALSQHWNVASKSAHFFIIKKPNISYEVMLIVMNMIYTTQCEIPNDLALPVACAANELLLIDDLTFPCLLYIATYILSPYNALKFYNSNDCAAIDPSGDYRREAVYAMQDDLTLALADGCEDLMLYSLQQLQELLKYPMLDNLAKWRIALHWTVSRPINLC
ncbi:hypothetical protein HDV05_005537 [Chytridiales sp. JEL 0842]|nr:hypothetical protein HDV05_005537 [Chytridiales sp. JEL 0842]